MIGIYLFFLVLFGLYSYTQIDLNLTLLQTNWFLRFQKEAIQLGYFQRPLSTAIFFILLLALSFISGKFVFKDKLDKKYFWLLIISICLVGVFSYPGFSHDIFNYIFDARILVTHQADPHITTALMFPSDTWTRFLQWTHRTYPYGPFFLPLTAMVYILGMEKFILTLFFFKTTMIIFFVSSVITIWQLAGKKAAMVFALNPLILIEAIIAGHLDIIMLALALLGYYFWIKGKRFLGWLGLLISVGIKYSTITLLPVFAFSMTEQERKWWLLILAGLGVLIQIINREILPHYFIVFLGFSTLIKSDRFQKAVFSSSIILLLIRYLPFLFTGQWWTLKLW